MKNNRLYFWLSVSIAIFLAICAGWMWFEVSRRSHAHYGLYRNTPQETIVIRPGRAVVAYYLFITGLSLLPAVWFFRSASTGGRKAPLIAGLFSIAATSLIAGFSYETLQSEIRLTLTNLNYRSGRTSVRMPWNEIQAIAVRTYSRSQWLELLAADDILRIDLAPFALPDKQMLVAQLPRIAKLGSIPRKLPDGWVWRRGSAIQVPE